MKHLYRPLFFLSFVGLLLVSSPVLAQEQPLAKRHGLQLSYGLLPAFLLADAMSELFLFGRPWSEWGKEDYDVVGPLNVGYTYDLSRKWQVGLTGSYTNLRTDYVWRNEDPLDPATLGRTKVDRLRSVAIMPKIQFNWVNNGKCELYSSFLAGINIMSQTYTETDEPDIVQHKTTSAFQMNLIGFSVGKRVRGFAEYGFGFTGMMNCGVAVKL